MKKTVALWSLLVLLPLTTTSHAGQVIYRETETGIYVELTGELEKMPYELISRTTRVTDAQVAAQPSSSVATVSQSAAGTAVEKFTNRKSVFSKRQDARRQAKESRQETPEEE